MSTDPLAQAAMVAYCGWDPTIPVNNETVLLDGNGTFWAFLPSLHVTAVTAVVVTNPDGSTYTATVGPGMTDVGWSENGTLTWQSCNNYGIWPAGQQSIAVTYSGGYSAAPPDLDAALASLTARMPKVQSGRTTARLGSAAIGYASNVAAGGLLLVEQMVFDRYRIPRAR
jgi:hypothetical protein